MGFQVAFARTSWARLAADTALLSFPRGDGEQPAYFHSAPGQCSQSANNFECNKPIATYDVIE